MAESPKHRVLSRELAAEVNAGKYPPGSRLPSEAQLVRRFNVSRPTVIRALRDLQEQGLIERRAGSGTYARASADSSFAKPPAYTQLGRIVPSLRQGEIFESICGELAGLARVHDIGLLWGGSIRPFTTGAEINTEEAEALCAQFIERRVAGVFYVPFLVRAAHRTHASRPRHFAHSASGRSRKLRSLCCALNAADPACEQRITDHDPAEEPTAVANSTHVNDRLVSYPDYIDFSLNINNLFDKNYYRASSLSARQLGRRAEFPRIDSNRLLTRRNRNSVEPQRTLEQEVAEETERQGIALFAISAFFAVN